MINPSAGYCTSLLCSDGQPCQYKIVNNPDGSQGGLCVDPVTGDSCDAWALFDGSCQLKDPVLTWLTPAIADVNPVPMKTADKVISAVSAVGPNVSDCGCGKKASSSVDSEWY